MINLVLLKFSGLQASQKKVFPQKKNFYFFFYENSDYYFDWIPDYP